jgi:hypothetical protein
MTRLSRWLPSNICALSKSGPYFVDRHVYLLVVVRPPRQSQSQALMRMLWHPRGSSAQYARNAPRDRGLCAHEVADHLFGFTVCVDHIVSAGCGKYGSVPVADMSCC